MTNLADRVCLQLHPNADGLPGTNVLGSLTDGIGHWALVLAIIGLVVGAGVWALGAHSHNYQQSFHGRRAVLASGVAALLVGAAPAMVTFFYAQGSTAAGGC